MRYFSFSAPCGLFAPFARILMVFILAFCTKNTYSQPKHPEATILLYNIGFGGVTAGIGAAINREDHKEKWSKAFLRGLWQGSLGGGVNYVSKKSIGLVTKSENMLFALNSRVIHSIGSSIIENASLGRPFLQNWNFVYGPVRLDFHFQKQNSSMRIRFLPMIIPSVISETRSARFDWRTSLITGALTFRGDSSYFSRLGLDGSATMWAITYVPNALKYKTISHELIHNFQYSEYLVVNSYFSRFTNKVRNEKVVNFFTKYVYLDVPYFNLAYAIEGRHEFSSYYKNYFEMEAERCATP